MLESKRTRATQIAPLALLKKSLRSTAKAIGIGLLLLSQLGGVASAANGPWTGITQIYSRADGGRPFLYFNTGAMPGCYNDRGGYLRNSDPSGADRTYSTVLAAMLADREVQVFYEVIAGATGWGMCEVTAVYVR